MAAHQGLDVIQAQGAGIEINASLIETVQDVLDFSQAWSKFIVQLALVLCDYGFHGSGGPFVFFQGIGLRAANDHVRQPLMKMTSFSPRRYRLADGEYGLVPGHPLVYVDRLLSFRKFQFDPGGLVIDFHGTSQTHMLAGVLGGQLGL